MCSNNVFLHYSTISDDACHNPKRKKRQNINKQWSPLMMLAQPDVRNSQIRLCGWSRIWISVNLIESESDQGRIKAYVRCTTFRSQMFPTTLRSSLAASAPASSLRPRSFARCRRQIKQKLVLISSILSFGYDFCNPEITDSKTRGSLGSVGRGVSTS